MKRGTTSKKKTQPAPVAAVAVAGSPKKLSNAKSSAQSTAMLSKSEQFHIMVEAMRRRDQTTSSFRDLGILQPSARVHGLRAIGYQIETTRITMVDHVGIAHSRAALYSLVSEPEGGA